MAARICRGSAIVIPTQYGYRKSCCSKLRSPLLFRTLNASLTQFPSISALAQAPTDNVLHLWTGLGYYARARNLHKTAQLIESEHHGQFPQTIEQAVELPGIGLSSAGAILSFAFGQTHSILDGNVKRVLCRHRTIEGWPGKTKTNNSLWALARELTPEDQASQYNQAIMDLGAHRV